jgi:hypothetical protein
MANPVIDTPQALDAAIDAKRRARREALASTARGEGMRVAEVLLGIVILLALIQIYIEPARAAYPALIACMTGGSVYFSRRSRKQEAARALRDLERDT